MYIRGDVISYSTFKAKQCHMEMETLGKQIRLLERNLNNDNLLKVKDLQVTRPKYNKLPKV